ALLLLIQILSHCPLTHSAAHVTGRMWGRGAARPAFKPTRTMATNDVLLKQKSVADTDRCTNNGAPPSSARSSIVASPPSAPPPPSLPPPPYSHGCNAPLALTELFTVEPMKPALLCSSNLLVLYWPQPSSSLVRSLVKIGFH